MLLQEDVKKVHPSLFELNIKTQRHEVFCKSYWGSNLTLGSKALIIRHRPFCEPIVGPIRISLDARFLSNVITLFGWKKSDFNTSSF